MNRIDRLFAITTRLQAHGRLRAADLARVFEVSTRTIYRDIAALSESGVPIVSLPGQGYALAEGYFLPPLVLSFPEATALVLGARMLSAHAGAESAAAAEQAIAKIFSALDEKTRRPVQEWDDVLDLATPADVVTRLDLGDERVATLRRAIHERRIVSIRYLGRNRAAETVRSVEPLRLGYQRGAWYLTAYCQLRAEERAFRLDRIEEFWLEAGQFTRRPPATSAVKPGVEVLVRFRGDAIRWVSERQHWSYAGEVETADGIAASYRPDNLDEIASWLLGWGTAAHVLSPPALRERLCGEARGLVEMLT